MMVQAVGLPSLGFSFRENIGSTHPHPNGVVHLSAGARRAKEDHNPARIAGISRTIGITPTLKGWHIIARGATPG